MRILISRTDSIGDVIFTLPMAGVLKKFFPHSFIAFLGQNYTKDVIEACKYVDVFYSLEDLCSNSNPVEFLKEKNFEVILHVFPHKNLAVWAKQAGISTRIGTNRRFFHWFTCNTLVNLTRKNSNTHEALLNLKLLKALNIHSKFTLEDIPELYGINKIKNIPNSKYKTFGIEENKFNLIFHPKSKGSAREWKSENYVQLFHRLPKDKFQIFITGTSHEKEFITREIVSRCPGMIDLVGAFSLNEFIEFISLCDGLIACSTGPLHISAAMEKFTIGFYPPIKNMDPLRWGALGKYSENIVGIPSLGKNFCKGLCAEQQDCFCLNAISVNTVLSKLLEWI